jgi:nifR3 family TIM-barrel protein
MQLGSLSIDFPFLLAPMAGYTDAAFRSICHDFGCGMTYTEVSVAQGLMRGSKPSWHLLETFEGEGPVAAHIYGCEPDVMAAVAVMAEKTGRFASVDINCGCPVRKIVAKGAGAALIHKPEQIGRIVRAVSSAVAIPVTVKTRIGFELGVERIGEIAQAVEENGAAMLAIHGRYARNHHRGDVDWKMIARIKKNCSIPVVGNGGIMSAEDAMMRMNQTGVDGIMIARGAVGRPWIFDDIARLQAGKEPLERTQTELRALIEEHLNRMMVLKEREALYRRKGAFDAEGGVAAHFRCHLIQYLSGFENWSDIRRRLNAVRSRVDIMDIVDAVFARQHTLLVPRRASYTA